jgi:hypothetical protein
VGTNESGRADPGHDGGWPLPGDPDAQVGSKHHLLPSFYLERFARNGRVAVIDPRTHVRRVSPISDTAAERDFYTSVTKDGQLSGAMEQLLGAVEGDAARAIRNVASIFGGGAGFEDRHAIALLLAFQMNRGRSARKRLELFADLTTRLLAEGIDTEERARTAFTSRGLEPTLEDVADALDVTTRLDEFEFILDPNDHISMMGQIALDALPYIVNRSWTIVEFPAPALITSDEPVSMFTSGPHGPEESLGLANAEELYFPLDPKRALILGRPEQRPTRLERLPGTAEAAAHINWLTAYNAYDHVFCHPDYDITFPKIESRSLFNVTTDASPTLNRYNEPPRRRGTQRRRRSDVQLVREGDGLSDD